jgi:hypothetical protein
MDNTGNSRSPMVANLVTVDTLSNLLHRIMDKLIHNSHINSIHQRHISSNSGGKWSPSSSFLATNIKCLLWDKLQNALQFSSLPNDQLLSWIPNAWH